MVFVLFVVVLVALMEFGRGMWTYATIAHAARQGVRYGMIRGSLNPTTLHDLKTVVKSNCVGLENSKIGVYPTWNGGADPSTVERGDFVEIQVTYPFEFAAAGLLVDGNTMLMSSTTRMMVVN